MQTFPSSVWVTLNRRTLDPLASHCFHSLLPSSAHPTGSSNPAPHKTTLEGSVVQAQTTRMRAVSGKGRQGKWKLLSGQKFREYSVGLEDFTTNWTGRNLRTHSMSFTKSHGHRNWCFWVLVEVRVKRGAESEESNITQQSFSLPDEG